MQIVPCFWEVGPFCAGWLVEKLAFPVAIAYFVYRLALYQIEKNRLANLDQLARKREIDFADKQLTEFYAPMVGARAEILNHTVFDTYLYRASRWVEQEWIKREGEGESGADDTTTKLFRRNADKRMRGERVVAYVAMRTLFAEKMAFADPDTRDWYNYFYAFVELLRVDKENSESHFLSQESAIALSSMFEEKPLELFYKHLLERTDQLQREIRGVVGERMVAPTPPEVGEPFLFVPARRTRKRED